MRFADRIEAGRRLAERLTAYEEATDVVVLGLPRGGVPVAAEVADALGAPLDVLLVRKLGVPGRDELFVGAIATGEALFVDEEARRRNRVSDDDLRRIVRQERLELERRREVYRGATPPVPLTGKTAVIVDDGLATGSTMRVAVEAAQKSGPRRIVVAVPVGSSAAVAELSRFADEVVCVSMPETFAAVGEWYDNFAPTSDEDVRRILEKSARRFAHPT